MRTRRSITSAPRFSIVRKMSTMSRRTTSAGCLLPTAGSTSFWNAASMLPRYTSLMRCLASQSLASCRTVSPARAFCSRCRCVAAARSCSGSKPRARASRAAPASSRASFRVTAGQAPSVSGLRLPLCRYSSTQETPPVRPHHQHEVVAVAHLHASVLPRCFGECGAQRHLQSARSQQVLGQGVSPALQAMVPPGGGSTAGGTSNEAGEVRTGAHGCAQAKSPAAQGKRGFCGRLHTAAH